jgi:protease-4
MAIVQTSVDSIYETFLGVVGRGRKLSRDAAHEVAQGRVWTGSQARTAKLVDRLGGLRDAINVAAEAASLTNYTLTESPALGEAQTNLAELLFSDEEPAPVFAQASRDPALALLKAQWRTLERLRGLNDRRGIYLLAPVGVTTR